MSNSLELTTSAEPYEYDVHTNIEIVDDSQATPVNIPPFIEYLEQSIDSHDDESAIAMDLSVIALYSDATFTDTLEVPENGLTPLFNRAESDITEFIEKNTPISVLSLTNMEVLDQLSQIYNVNNLVALAKQMVEMSNDSISIEGLYMLYRYRNVLKQISLRKEIIQARTTERAGRTSDGASTWAGYVHGYGFEKGGVINSAEYSEFSEREDQGVYNFTFEGEMATYRVDGLSKL